jgi:hypothetical protein
VASVPTRIHVTDFLDRSPENGAIRAIEDKMAGGLANDSLIRLFEILCEGRLVEKRR